MTHKMLLMIFGLVFFKHVLQGKVLKKRVAKLERRKQVKQVEGKTVSNTKGMTALDIEVETLNPEGRRTMLRRMLKREIQGGQFKMKKNWNSRSSQHISIMRS